MNYKWVTTSEEPLVMKATIFHAYPEVGYQLSIIQKSEVLFEVTVSDSNDNEVYQESCDSISAGEDLIANFISKNWRSHHQTLEEDKEILSKLIESFESSNAFKTMNVVETSVSHQGKYYKLQSENEFETSVVSLEYSFDGHRFSVRVTNALTFNSKAYGDKSVGYESIVIKYYNMAQNPLIVACDKLSQLLELPQRSSGSGLGSNY